MVRVESSAWIAVGFLTCAPVFAEWQQVSVRQLLGESDVAVVAVLSGAREYSDGETDYGEGRLTVEEVVFGSVGATRQLTLKWSNRRGLACPRVEHLPSKGKRAVWLLKTQADGSVRADHPGRVIPLDASSLAGVREEVAAVEPGKHEPKLRALVAAVKRLTSKE